MITAIPGDTVLFNGREWTVFVASKSDAPEALVAIYRPSQPGRACDLIDIIRQRQELPVVPRIARQQ